MTLFSSFIGFCALASKCIQEPHRQSSFLLLFKQQQEWALQLFSQQGRILNRLKLSIMCLDIFTCVFRGIPVMHSTSNNTPFSSLILERCILLMVKLLKGHHSLKPVMILFCHKSSRYCAGLKKAAFSACKPRRRVGTWPYPCLDA